MAKAPKLFKVVTSRRGRQSDSVGTIDDLNEWFGYTLECGESYQNESGNAKINRNPRGIKSFIKNVCNASNNSAANGYSGTSYSEGIVTPEDKAKYLAERV